MPDKRYFSAIIFDLDGTLADTAGDICSAVNAMRASYDLQALSREEILANINRGASELVRGCLPESKRGEESLRLALKEYTRQYERLYLEQSQAYAGLVKTLHTLRQTGYRMCVLTNKQDAIAKRLTQELYGGSLFDEVLGYNGAYPHKPDPKAALYLLGKMKVSPSGAVLAGDSGVDIATAVNAGMYPLGVSWGYRDASELYGGGAACVVDTPEIMLDFLLSRFGNT